MVMSSPEAPRNRRFAARLLSWTLRLVYTAVLIVLTLYLGLAFQSRSKPALALWHTVSLASEFRAQHGGPKTSFADYLEREARVFEDLESEICRVVGHSQETLLSRFDLESRANPRHQPRNWNRSYQLDVAETPSADNVRGAWPRGAALLIHGLTDSPYSLRRVGDILREEGYRIVGLRLPGHGTNPGTLATTSTQDWKAAVRIAARHTARLAADGKFLVVGYSAGGALAVDYTIDSVLDEGLRTPDRLVLFSPAIGITRFAALASWHKLVSWMNYFEKFRWQNVQPEYDPFKYNSFPMNAGEQMHRLALSVQRRLRGLDRAGRMGEMPEILAFQSLIDSTVLTQAIISDLFDDLKQPGSELVLFDLNRIAPLRPFLSSRHADLPEQVRANPKRRYVLTLIANVDEGTRAVAAFRYPPGALLGTSRPLGVEWPEGVYSLSHVALPFSPDDPLYGGPASASPSGLLRLGTLAPRGEKGLLRVSVSNLMRLRYNPFFGYVETRLRAWVD